MIVSAILLLIVWIVLNGLSLDSLSVGVAILLIIQFLRYKSRNMAKFPFNFKVIQYFFWLIGEVFHSALRVVKIIWHYPKDFSPDFYKINTIQNTNIGKVLYANSITLTPGTFTVDIGDKLLVHSITHQSDWDKEMDKRIQGVIKC